MTFRILLRVALPVGRLQAALAEDYREGGSLRKICVYPTYIFSRTVYIVLLDWLEWVIPSA